MFLNEFVFFAHIENHVSALILSNEITDLPADPTSPKHLTNHKK